MLDEHIAASADLFGKIDPDDAIDAVRIVVAELQGARRAERSEDRAEQSSFVWAQPAMLGKGKLYAEMDNASLATVINGMDASAPADDGRSLAQRRADGLVAMAALRLAEDVVVEQADEPTGIGAAADEREGSDGDAAVAASPRRRGLRRLRPAVPSIDVVVDLNDVSVTAAGGIQIKAPGCLPTLTARAVEALAQDAAVRVVLFDGGRPLTATRKVWARDIPSDVRAAVKVRDRGDRFPGSRGVIEHIHHFDSTRPGAAMTSMPCWA